MPLLAAPNVLVPEPLHEIVVDAGQTVFVVRSRGPMTTADAQFVVDRFPPCMAKEGHLFTGPDGRVCLFAD